MTDSLTTQQLAISAQIFADEGEILKQLCENVPQYNRLQPVIFEEAKALVNAMRQSGLGHGVEAFLQQYGLETQEGVAIMCMAEALLRIPDDHTADELIRDKFEGRAWDKHLGQSESLFVNASSWGLMLTGKLVDFSAAAQQPSALLKKLVGRVGEPVIREALKTAVKYIGTQFVMGTDIRDAMAKARSAEKKGYQLSYDILGEGARTEAQAKAYFDAYMDAIAAIGKAKASQLPSLSIKLSALHPKYYLQKEERVKNELYPRLKALCLAAKNAGLMVAIDAEESYRLDMHMMLFRMLREDAEFKDYEGLGFVMQAYQKRAYSVAEWLAALAKATGHKIPVRLVKGAYWDTEIKLAQVMGYPAYPVFTRKAATDVSYLACAEKLLSHRDLFYPQFATHNALTLAAIRKLAADTGWQNGSYEFQRLHGMGEKLYDQLIGEIPCRIYAPIGEHKDLLAYLIRRLLENGANTSFVNQLMDQAITVETLLADPVTKTVARGFDEATALPLPEDIYGNRKNSKGFDFGNLAQRDLFMRQLSPWLDKRWEAGKKSEEPHPVYSPVDGAQIGIAYNADEAAVKQAFISAKKAHIAWDNVTVEERARILEQAAQLFEANQFELMALCIREAGKTLSDAVAEIREAIDFLRYYAVQARYIMAPQLMPGPTGESNMLHMRGRGVFVCISPWNFPLAIFTGQVAAALVTGNAVLAKPAEQTPLVAARAVQLLHEAGIPPEVLQLVPGKGNVTGQALVSHTDTAGVCFTGSVTTAWQINRTLAARDGAIVPLIAETGGQNSMVVDSTALIEQAVDDILLSAFGSAGQRCSALRVLYVQEEIADQLVEMLKAAVSELKIGNPAEFSTDIGPVIDSKARNKLQAHIEEMTQSATLIARIERVPAQGSFLSPYIFEIKDITMLKEEHFGPILHIIRFKAAELESLPEKINATSFGLTFGLHSRIEEHWQLFQRQIAAGNCYINRSMIGATVGVQPFGGEGLSGTGPKAGGPHYLLRFTTERTVTINTAAIGGNLELLAG